MFVVGTEGAMSAEDEKNVIEQEIDNGADALIIQPAAGEDTEEMLKDISQRIPVLLVESETLGDKESPEIPVIQADNYSMGRTLAEELLKEYDGNLEGKTIGIAVETEALEATRSRREGFMDGPDEFSVGYQSLTRLAENLRRFFKSAEGSTVTHTVIRKENLFTEENQEIIYTMSQ